MKTFLLTLAVLGMSASAFAATPKYFMADNVKIETAQLTQGNTVVTLNYDRPCWAEKVDVVSSTDILGSPVNPASDFVVALGVLLKEKNDTHLCSMHEPPVVEETVATTVNTNAVEGQFKGFRLIQSSIAE